MNVYDFKLKDNEGKEISLKDYEGKVLLIVNTATECGFTPQYEDLQKIYDELKDKGLEIIDIPSNQFGGQAPGSDEEISQFCSLNLGTAFPRMAKSDVNGENQLPLYEYLKKQKGFEGFGESEMAGKLKEMFASTNPEYEKTPDIKWNFTKFLVDQKGKVVARFEPTADMAEVKKAIEELLS